MKKPRAVVFDKHNYPHRRLEGHLRSARKTVEYKENSELCRKGIVAKEVVTLHRGSGNEKMSFRIKRIKKVNGTVEIHLADGKT